VIVDCVISSAISFGNAFAGCTCRGPNQVGFADASVIEGGCEVFDSSFAPGATRFEKTSAYPPFGISS